MASESDEDFVKNKKLGLSPKNEKYDNFKNASWKNFWWKVKLCDAYSGSIRKI